MVRSRRASTSSSYSGGSLPSAPSSPSLWSSGEDADSDLEDGKGNVRLNGARLTEEIIATIREQAKDKEDVMRLIKTRFDAVDHDKNGFIDMEEFRQLLVSILGGREVLPEDAHDLLKRFNIDVNGNGKVSYDEFVSFVSLDRTTIEQSAVDLRKSLLRALQREHSGSIPQAFARYCNPKKNVIGEAEFRKLASSLVPRACTMTDGEMRCLMSYMDIQGKGSIEVSDFQSFLEKDGPQLAEERAVTDIRIVFVNKKAEQDALLAQGYIRVTANMWDTTTKESYVHLFVKKESKSTFKSNKDFLRQRVTDIVFSPSNKDASLLALGYTCAHRKSTNQGKWFAKRQYLWFRRNSSSEYGILDVAVTGGNIKDKASRLWTPPARGYRRIEGDMSQGNTRIFLWYYKDNFETADAANPNQILALKIRQMLRDSEDERNARGEQLDLERIWEKLDTQGRGWLNIHKFKSMLRDIGLKVSKSEFDAVVALLDTNQNGRLDREEFLDFLSFNPAEIAALVRRIKFALVEQGFDTKAKMTKWFLGSNKSKYTRTVKEFSKMIKTLGIRLTSDECKSLVGRFDRNGDGLIDLKEFLTYVASRNDPKAPVTTADADYLLVETAGRKLRAYVRSLATSSMDFDAACDIIFEHEDRLTKNRMQYILEHELQMTMAPDLVQLLLLRVGKTREKFILFCSSSNYLDSILNLLAEIAEKQSPPKFFKQFDVDGSGSISQDEFRKGLELLTLDGKPIHLTNKEIELIMNRFDQDGDGQVDFEEFSKFMLSNQQARQQMDQTLVDMNEKKLGDPRVLYVFSMIRKRIRDKLDTIRTLFRSFVPAGFSEFTSEDLEAALRKLQIAPQQVQISASQIQQIFRRFDMNGRGRVNMIEFERFFEMLGGDTKPAPLARIRHRLHKALNRHIEAILHELQGVDVLGRGSVPERAFIKALSKQLDTRSLELVCSHFHDQDGVLYEEFLDWVSESSNNNNRQHEDESDDSSTSPKSPPRSFRRSVVKKYPKKSKLSRELMDYSSGPENKIDRRDVNRAFESMHLPSVSKEMWKSLRLRDGRVTVATFCNRLYDTDGSDSDLSFSSRERGRRDRREDSGDDSVSQARVDEESKRLTLLLEDAMRREKFSYENACKMFDVDGSGSITFADLQRILHVVGFQCTSNVLHAMIKKLGASRRHGRKVNYEYFFGVLLNDHKVQMEHPHVDVNAVESKVKQLLRARSGVFDVESEFSKLDRIGNGKISLVDFSHALERLGVDLSPAEMRALLRKYDRNSDGYIDLTEFSQLTHYSEADIDTLLVRIKTELRAQARYGGNYGQIFEQYDLNGDGYLSRREFRQCLDQILGGMISLSDAEVRRLMDRFSINGNSGKIGYRAFCEMCRPSDLDMHVVEQKLRQKIRDVAATSRMRDVFRMFDQHGTGRVSRFEFQQACRQLGLLLSDEELDLLVDRLGGSGNHNYVDYNEFSKFASDDDLQLDILLQNVGGFFHELMMRRKDPVLVFEKQEKRRYPIGLLRKHQFHRSCKDLKVPCSDDELSALADLYVDSQDANLVQYREFCVTALERAGYQYTGSAGRGPRRDDGSDQVWNADNCTDWLTNRASAEERAAFMKIQESMAKMLHPSQQMESVEERPPKPVIPPSDSPQFINSKWACPVCFYQQTKVGRKTCEMCDSPFPSKTSGQWPHIKPILDQAYQKVGNTALVIEDSKTSHEDEESDDDLREISRSGAPRWHFT